jgi:hypothetical protein
VAAQEFASQQNAKIIPAHFGIILLHICRESTPSAAPVISDKVATARVV